MRLWRSAAVATMVVVAIMNVFFWGTRRGLQLSQFGRKDLDPLIPEAAEDVNSKQVTSTQKAGKSQTQPEGTPKIQACKDDNSGCAQWAETGECLKNPASMLEICKASCATCEPPQTPNPSEYVLLNSGHQMPSIGFGTAGLGSGTGAAVAKAIEVGYRHIDSAQAREWYREDLVGQAINTAGIPRAELFLTSKLHPRHLGYEPTWNHFESSLKDFNTSYLDLFLLHYASCWGNLCKKAPSGTWRESWRALEGLVRAGKVKSIGVSNFNVRELTELVAMAQIQPSVVQRHSDILSQDMTVQKYCELNGIQYVAYSSLGTQWLQRSAGTNPVLHHPLVVELAVALERSPAQVLLRWGLQHKQVVIPRSSNASRMQENLHVFDFALSAQQMNILDSLDGSRAVGS